jgi:hypothetical protein
MKDLLERFIKIERAVSEEMGDFDLFALFLREDEQTLWDVVVAAPWIEVDQRLALRYLGERLQRELTTDQLMRISHIAIIDADNPGLPEVTETVQVEHGLVEMRNQEFFGHSIKHAFFITSQPMLAKELRPAA